MPSSAKKSPFLPHIIIGLGNPGQEYVRTYHNAGHIALDVLREILAPTAKKRSRPSFDYWSSDAAILVRPKVFMNESGRATADALAFFHESPERLLIIHDDSDLPFGTYRVSTVSGAAGHRGVASIIGALGTKEFHRLRLGIRVRAGKAGSFVLHSMSDEEVTSIAETAQNAMRKLTENPTPSGSF